MRTKRQIKDNELMAGWGCIGLMITTLFIFLFFSTWAFGQEMKYTVSWTAEVQVDCGFPETDVYGNRIPVPSLYCAELRPMAKEFTDRKKAIKFFDIGNYNKPLSMEIDSVKLKQ